MIEIDFEMPNLYDKVQRHRDEIHLSLAAAIQTNRGMLFDQEGAYNGHDAWAPLRFRSGQILSDRGTLRKSLAPRPAKGAAGPDGIVELGADVVTVGTMIKYAAMMNFGTVGLPGGVLRPTHAKVLKIPLPQGKSANDSAKKLQEESGKQKASRLLIQLEGKMARSKKPEVVAKYADRIAKVQKRLKTGQGGAKFIYRKWVKIPPRPFDMVNDEDRLEFESVMANKIMEVLRR